MCVCGCGGRGSSVHNNSAKFDRLWPQPEHSRNLEILSASHRAIDTSAFWLNNSIGLQGKFSNSIKFVRVDGISRNDGNASRIYTLDSSGEFCFRSATALFRSASIFASCCPSSHLQQSMPDAQDSGSGSLRESSSRIITVVFDCSF